MTKHIEVELKFPLLNFSEVEAFLGKNAEFKYESRQKDNYFNPPHRNFLENKDNVCEWLRLRETKNGAQINYKDWLPHEQKKKTHCIEYETDISSYENLFNILQALNFTELITVDKIRKVWKLNDVEISVDFVKGIGEFIEIEYKGESDDINYVREYLFSFLDRIGAATAEIDLKGYPFLLMEQKNLI